MPLRSDDFTLDGWLQEISAGATLDEAKRKVFLETLKDDPQVVAAIRDGWKRQSEFNRDMNEHAEKRKAADSVLEERRVKLIKDYEDLAQWRARAIQEVKKANETRDEALQRSQKLQVALKKAATDHGVPLEEIGVDSSLLSPMDAVVSAAASGTGASGGLSREDMIAEMQRRESLYAGYPVELHDIGVAHRRIFGEDVELAPLLDQARKQERSIREVWQEKYDPDKKVAEQQQKVLDDRLKAADAAGYERGRQESIRIVPGQPPGDFPHSPVFAVSDREKPDTGTSPTAHRSYLEKAAESLDRGLRPAANAAA